MGTVTPLFFLYRKWLHIMLGTGFCHQHRMTISRWLMMSRWKRWLLIFIEGYLVSLLLLKGMCLQGYYRWSLGTASQSQALLAEITIQEIKRKNGKAHDADGLTSDFFKTKLEIDGNVVLEASKSFLNMYFPLNRIGIYLSL